MDSAFLCADLGITPEARDDHASYLDHWLKVLKADSRAIFTAASQAQRAADYLHELVEPLPRAAETAVLIRHPTSTVPAAEARCEGCLAS